MNEPAPSTSVSPRPPQDNPSQVAAGSTGNSAHDDILLCTPVDEIIDQIRKLVQWILTLRWWLALGTLVGAVCGVMLGLTLLNSNTAYSTFRVLTAQHENPLGKFSREAIRFFNAPSNIFPSESLVAKTMARLDQNSPTPLQIYEARRKLDIIDFGQDIYEVSFRDRDAKRALEFLNAHIKTYAESEIEANLDTLRREVQRIKDTLNTVGERMNHTQDRVFAFRTEHADALPEYALEHMQNLRALERKVSELSAESADLIIERKHIEEQLKIEPFTIPVETKERREQVDVNVADARLSLLRLQINELRARGLLDVHPYLQRLLVEYDQLAKSSEKILAGNSKDERPATVPQQHSTDQTDKASRLGLRGLKLAPAISDGASTLVENRPNERRAQMQTRLNTLLVKADQLDRQISDANTQMTKASSIVANLPLLEKRFAELNRGQTADINTYQQVAMVLEMAEFQLKLEQDSAPSRLDLFNPPRLRVSSPTIKLLASAITGALVGITLIGAAWSLMALRLRIWPQGFAGAWKK